jgi:hypothetical protein
MLATQTSAEEKRMNNLPDPKVHPFPPQHRLGKSWPEIAQVFTARADRERKLAWEQLGSGDEYQYHRHIARSEALDEAAAFCRGQPDEAAPPADAGLAADCQGGRTKALGRIIERA